VRPNYTALAAGPEGSFTVAWLDARNGSQQVFSASGKVGGKAMDSLAFAGVDGKGVCPCCDVAALRGPDGRALLAFRHNRDGFRDIYVTHGSDVVPGSFDEPLPVSADHWKFEGCPHDAPSVALTGKTLHVAWMDARGQEAGVSRERRRVGPKFVRAPSARRQWASRDIPRWRHPATRCTSSGMSAAWRWEEPAKEEHAHGHKLGGEPERLGPGDFLRRLG
jgi:hypothetical protein